MCWTDNNSSNLENNVRMVIKCVNFASFLSTSREVNSKTITKIRNEHRF